jgi:15-cis-phytoene synthase
MDPLFTNTTFQCSKLITENYSTSFSMGIKVLKPHLRNPIYGIYGFVRFADEIVDTFHEFDKKYLLNKFKEDTYEAIKTGISLNPVLHAFQSVVKEFNIDLELIDAFLLSMQMDLDEVQYQDSNYDKYIYGSAEVVGLMCLKVFVKGNAQVYENLKADARSLGAAFQKVNFLRDFKSDFEDRGRVYFPGVDFNRFTPEDKKKIESDIQADFDAALRGIKNLPDGSREGVYLAYVYYLKLFNKIKKTAASQIKETRIRVPDNVKLTLLCKTYIKNIFGLI